MRDHRNEVAFLSDPPAGFDAPALLLHGQNEREAWIVREQWPGELLIDLIRAGVRYDSDAVLRDVVTQLAALEAAGLHHNDVRAWNVLIGPDGRARLIDYGAISRDAKDCGWPRDLFLSFLIFAHETISGAVENLSPLRAPKLNPDDLPEPYRSAFWRLFDGPADAWRFARLRDGILETADDRETPPATAPTGVTAMLRAMEEACGLYRASTQEWRNRAAQAEAQARQLQNLAQAMASPTSAAPSGARQNAG
jgi:hypothetical protein